MPAHRHRGFTLIEFLTTVAMLVIVGGLMVSLARYVRTRSAHLLTVEVLGKLEQAMARYTDATGIVPDITPFVPGKRPDRIDPAHPSESLMPIAAKNNRDFIRALRSREDLSGRLFSNLPATMYDERTLSDAWGSPIVFMQRMHPDIGMAPDDTFFFVSAGPDGQFLTRDDNLYSYEVVNSP